MVALSPLLTTPATRDMRWFRVEGPSTAASCRSAAIGMSRELGFPPARGQEVALAVSEAASNLHKHAGGGALLLRAVHDRGMPGIEVVTIDSGPGVRDVAAAMRNGHSTAGTLGIGLGAISRMADFCDIYSVLGRGTTLAARFLPEPGQPAPRCAGLVRPITGEAECGDVYAVFEADGWLTGMVCDGLGHGPLAAAAARQALAAVAAAPADEPAALLERAHQSMSGTRGGAVAVAQTDGSTVRFAGLGNIGAWVVTGDSRHGMASVPGIAGHHARRVRQFEYPAPPQAAVIMHSDGLSSRWDMASLPGLIGRDPLQIAAVLLAVAGVRRDDAGILVVKP